MPIPRPLFLCLIVAAMGCEPSGPATSKVVPEADSAKERTPSAQDGPQVIHTEDGGRMEGMQVGGKRTGPWLSYFADGGIRSRANYENGLEEGPTEVFHPTGKPYYTGQYSHGTPVGKWVFFNEEGTEVKQVTYDSTGVLMP